MGVSETKPLFTGYFERHMRNQQNSRNFKPTTTTNEKKGNIKFQKNPDSVL
jgi:hypothetical protein